MNAYHGFSLTEVLVSLLLMTGTSMALLNQQWQISQLVNQLQVRTQALTQLDNASELIIAGQEVFATDKRFQIQKSQTKRAISLQITWESPGSQNNNPRLMQRQLGVS